MVKTIAFRKHPSVALPVCFTCIGIMMCGIGIVVIAGLRTTTPFENAAVIVFGAIFFGSTLGFVVFQWFSWRKSCREADENVASDAREAAEAAARERQRQPDDEEVVRDESQPY
jgi:hypothetical protein